MPEWDEINEVAAKNLRVGQKVRAYRGAFTRAEGIVRKDDEGDLYADNIGYFTNVSEIESSYGGWKKNWDRLEVHNVTPTDPGYYVSGGRKPMKMVARNERYWLIDSVAYTDDDPKVTELLPFTKLVPDKNWQPPVDEPQDEDDDEEGF